MDATTNSRQAKLVDCNHDIYGALDHTRLLKIKFLCTIRFIVLNAPPRRFLIKRSNRPKNQYMIVKSCFDADDILNKL